ncbi:restriction endonuclease subunit S [Gallibacterium trehalosifermentans]|uniref:Restriction endonuclease subunit S n=1 Tax=Gallibacterium trehalosifermentans TaxID=516935 RepID=A0ABV6GZC9_9PAST
MLGEVLISLKTGLNPRSFFTLNTQDANNYYVTIRELKNGKIIFSEKTDRINDEALKLCNNRSNLEVGDVLFSGTGTIGETAVIKSEPKNWNIKEGVYTLKPNKSFIISKFLMYVLRADSIKEKIMEKVAGGTVKSIPMKELKNIQIPLPPIETQKQIVEILDKFDTLTNSISEGLPREIELRQKQYEYYREMLLGFK